MARPAQRAAKIPVPSSPASSPRVRRTQDERSAHTRGLLLDATIDCLHELGYANTTTTVIADRAGVSRGAQLHHFPTKRELVTSAVEHLCFKRLEDFRSSFAALPPDADKIKGALELLWRGVDSPAFYAWLEIAVAARTDKELRATCKRIDLRFGAAVRETFRDIFGMPQTDGPLDLTPTFALLFMQGVAIDQMILQDPVRTQTMLKMLRGIGRRMLTPR
jgi:AcrR family transcriptional regulator